MKQTIELSYLRSSVGGYVPRPWEIATLRKLASSGLLFVEKIRLERDHPDEAGRETPVYALTEDGRARLDELERADAKRKAACIAVIERLDVFASINVPLQITRTPSGYEAVSGSWMQVDADDHVELARKLEEQLHELRERAQVWLLELPDGREDLLRTGGYFEEHAAERLFLLDSGAIEGPSIP